MNSYKYHADTDMTAVTGLALQVDGDELGEGHNPAANAHAEYNHSHGHSNTASSFQQQQHFPYAVVYDDDHDIKDEMRIAPCPIIYSSISSISQFIPTIPTASRRYFKNEIAFPRSLEFSPDEILSQHTHDRSAALNLEPYMQAGWETYTHPEGLKYYYHPRYRVLTDANLQSPVIYTKLAEWVNELLQIRSEIQGPYSIDLSFPLESQPQPQSQFQSQSYEIVLELYPDFSCRYYVADNDRQIISFFDRADTAQLGLPDVVSVGHLKLQLHRQYWRHTEYFPAHRPASESAQSALTAILSHAWADGMTSDLSTSPYSPEVCQESLQILGNLTGKPEQEVYRTCIIGRLMNEFTQARFINLYGEDQAVRLANDQSIFPLAAQQQQCASERVPGVQSGKFSQSFLAQMICEIAFVVLLRQPEKEFERLNKIWVDKIAYTASWRRFVSERIKEWRNVLTISLGFTFVDLLLVLFLRRYASTSIWSNNYAQVLAYQFAVASLLLNTCSTIVGLVAISVHMPHQNSTASNAASYFTNTWHKTSGFKPLSIALCLPRALATWALVGTTLSISMLSLESLNLFNLLFSCVFSFTMTGVLTWAVLFFVRAWEDENAA